MFSIIVPLFNKSFYIEKCLQSILNQSILDFEVIVVNDGSTDDGPEKVKNMIAKNTEQHASDIHCSIPVIQIIDQPNYGVSTARNNGVKVSKYDYIAFLDADDWWEPTFLEEMKTLILAFPNAGIFGCGYYTVKNGRRWVEPIGVDHSFEKGLINYFGVYAKTLSMPLTSISVVIGKTVFVSENGFKPELKLGEDFDLWIRIAIKYPVAFLNKPLANYNQDVDLAGRAVGNLHQPGTNILWNLDYLASVEQTNADLKQLLDNLRVYNLFPYFLNKDYCELARKELNKVDWSKQPISAKRRYNKPLLVLKMIYQGQRQASLMKQFFLRSLNKSKN